MFVIRVFRAQSHESNDVFFDDLKKSFNDIIVENLKNKNIDAQFFQKSKSNLNNDQKIHIEFIKKCVHDFAFNENLKNRF